MGTSRHSRTRKLSSRCPASSSSTGTCRTPCGPVRAEGSTAVASRGFVRRVLTLLYFVRCVRSRPDRNGCLDRRPARVHGCSGDARRTRTSAHRAPESRITRTDCTGPVPPKSGSRPVACTTGRTLQPRFTRPCGATGNADRCGIFRKECEPAAHGAAGRASAVPEPHACVRCRQTRRALPRAGARLLAGPEPTRVAPLAASRSFRFRSHRPAGRSAPPRRERATESFA